MEMRLFALFASNKKKEFHCLFLLVDLQVYVYRSCNLYQRYLIRFKAHRIAYYI